MAIDFNAIRAKLNQLSGTGTRRNVMWRPQEGEEATVRLLSFNDNDGQPFKELWFYYNIGNNPGLLAPKQFGKPDPIQELINKLRDDGDKDSYELAKKLYPKMRCFAPVIVRGEEDKGVRLWSFGKMVYQSLLNVMLDEDYGDITDPNEGRDVKVTCVKPPGRMWATTTVRPRGKSTILSEDVSQMTEWLDSVPSLDDLYELKDYDVLEKLVNDWLNEDSDDETVAPVSAKSIDSVVTSLEEAVADVDDEPKGSTKPAEKNEQYRSLDEAFADLEDL